jgi:hypothetical protein
MTEDSELRRARLSRPLSGLGAERLVVFVKLGGSANMSKGSFVPRSGRSLGEGGGREFDGTFEKPLSGGGGAGR